MSVRCVLDLGNGVIEKPLVSKCTEVKIFFKCRNIMGLCSLFGFIANLKCCASKSFGLVFLLTFRVQN